MVQRDPFIEILVCASGYVVDERNYRQNAQLCQDVRMRCRIWQELQRDPILPDEIWAVAHRNFYTATEAKSFGRFKKTVHSYEWAWRYLIGVARMIEEIGEKESIMSDEIAVREWHTRAIVRFLETTTVGSIDPPGKCTYYAGEEYTMVQWGRAGKPINRNTWWSDFDIDGAFIVRSDQVEIVKILENVSPI